MYGFTTVLYKIVVVLLSILAFYCRHLLMPSGSIEERDIPILTAVLPLKIASKAN